MENRFLCPKCRSELKVKNNIIFTAKNEMGDKGIILFNQNLGNYNLIHDPNFSIDKGEHIHFFCPICHSNLGIPKVNEDLAEVIMIDSNEIEYEIIFSVVAGKQCTIKLKDNSIIEKYGDDADEYQNFWGAGPSY